MVDRAIALFGTSQPVPDQIDLRAGPVSVTFENGALRWIRLGDVEAFRGIAFLVRDRNWDTPDPDIIDLKVDRTNKSFRVTFNAVCRTRDGELPWSAEITGEENGTLKFTGTARPTRDFITSRTGFVVLHPLARVSGSLLEVAHTNGTMRLRRFPEFIDPEQCFSDIRSLSHEVVPGVWATCVMEGDAWEMEDHRNWLDASFKTYVRPLALPYPYIIAGGSIVTQTVTLRFTGATARAVASASAAASVEIVLNGSDKRMPAIGLRAPLQWLDEANAASPLLRETGVQFVNGRFDPRRGHGVKELQHLGGLASALGARLTVEFVAPCRRDPIVEMEEFARQLRESGIEPESIMVAVAEDRIRLEPGAPPPPLALLGEVYRAARAALPGMRIGGGTFGFFAELNRNWPPLGLIDYIAHIVCSVVHAADDRAIMENLESFSSMTRTIRAFAGNIPYRIVGSSIGLDIGPYGEPSPNPANIRRTMVRMDPRHRGLFGAAWTLAAIAEAARGGIEAITPAAAAGELGIVHHRLRGSELWFDGCARPSVYPIYHVIRGMAKAAGRSCIGATSSDQTRIAVTAYREVEGATTMWLANLTDKQQRVQLPDIGADLSLVCLDEANFEEAALDTAFMQTKNTALSRREIEIEAFGIARIQAGGH